MHRRHSYYLLTIFVSVFLLSSLPVFAIVRPMTFPVNATSSFRNDFSEPRGGGTREHLGIDIIASKMTPIVAAVDGTVTYVAIPQPRWGYSITIRDSEGYQYRYLHINNDTPGTDDGLGGEANAYVAGIKRGVQVTAGQHISWVGDSGNAEETISHLHFEIRDPNRTPINPYESLIAAAAKSPIGASINTGTAIAIEHKSEDEATIAADSEYIFTTDMKEGDSGVAVRQLQLVLKSLGYFTSNVTDYFGPITRTALVRYQIARNIEPTGAVGAKTRALLNEGNTPPETQNGLIKELFQGDREEAVRQLQTKLSALGYYKGAISDLFASTTRMAVQNFQIATKLNPTGYVDALTWNRLQEEFARVPTTPPSSPPPTSSIYVFRDSLSEGSSGEAVRQLQLALQTLGHFATSPTGYFGPITKAAVISFQIAKKIDPLGLVGPKTRAALNGL